MAEKHGIYLLLSLTNNWNPLPGDNHTNSTSGALQRRDVSTNNSLPRNTLSNDYGGELSCTKSQPKSEYASVGMDAYVRAFGADSHDAFYTNEVCSMAIYTGVEPQRNQQTIIAAFENYTTHLVARYVNSTSVLAW